jgi:hypothetical protein
MTGKMTWIWIVGGIICGWATLRVLGAERERRIYELPHRMALKKALLAKAEAEAQAASQPPPSGTHGSHPLVRSKPAR